MKTIEATPPVELLREQLRQYVERAGEKSLRMMGAIFEIEEEVDFWDELPDEVKEDVEASIVASERGEGMKHEEFRKTYSQWLTK